MVKEILKEFIITRCEARAFEVLKGRILRVIAVEGKQVGDMTALNLHDFRETFSAIWTSSANDRCLTKAKNLYAGPPTFRKMFDLVEDKYGVHWVHGRCTRQMYELVHGIENHGNCHDNIAEVLGAYGISEYDVPLGTFNIFMNGRFDEDGRYFFDPPLIEKGDSVDFLAEMDLLVAISACPDDLSTINDYTPKPLKVEIFRADTESGG